MERVWVYTTRRGPDGPFTAYSWENYHMVVYLSGKIERHMSFKNTSDGRLVYVIITDKEMWPPGYDETTCIYRDDL